MCLLVYCCSDNSVDLDVLVLYEYDVHVHIYVKRFENSPSLYIYGGGVFFPGL